MADETESVRLNLGSLRSPMSLTLHADNNERVTVKVQARSVGMLPYRIEAVTLRPKTQEIEAEPRHEEAEPPKGPKARKARG